MRGTKTKKIALTGYGSFLGMEKGCFLVRDKKGKERKYPLFEEKIGEVILKTGNMVSTGALSSLGFWEIDTMILTRRGKPVAMLKSLQYDTHAETRLKQYEAYKNAKGMQVAKQIVIGKLKGQNHVLRKHGLEVNENVNRVVESIEADNLGLLRRKLLSIEGRHSRQYFKQLFQLFPKQLRPKRRKTWKAYDGLNNIFNLAYEWLKWKCQIALIKARLEVYLGFLHSIQHGKPSLVCDFQDLYRYLVDDFLIQHCHQLKIKDLKMEWDDFSTRRKGKRQYLNNTQTRRLMNRLREYFQLKVRIPRIRIGKKQEIETLINEEAYLLAKYIRGERQNWKPRIPSFSDFERHR